MEIKVSIVVAIYNIEDLISRCIDSLCNQTLKDIEIILVDDCSTDDSGIVCDNYAKKYQQIKVIHKKINQGLSEARNTGLEFANGKYVAFVDGDDYVDLDAYEKLYLFAEHYQSEVVVFGYYNDDIKGNIIKHEKNVKKIIYKNDEVLEELFPRVIGTLPNEKSDYDIGFAPWANFYNVEFLKKNNLKFVSERKLIYEDLMFALDVYTCTKNVIICKEAFYHYCENKLSLTQKPNLTRYDRVKEMYIFLKNTFKYNNLLFSNENINLRFKRTILSYIRLCIMQDSTSIENVKHIKYICNDSFCNEIIKNYPFKELSFKQKIFTYFLYKKNSYGLYLVCRLNQL